MINTVELSGLESGMLVFIITISMIIAQTVNILFNAGLLEWLVKESLMQK